MEVEFSLIPEDILAAERFHTRRHWRRVIFLYKYVGVFILAGMVVSLSCAVPINQNAWLPLLIIFVIPISAFIMFGLIIYLSRDRIALSRINRALRKGKNTKLIEPRKLKISPEGIFVSSTTGAGITMWTAIEKIAVTNDHVFFYVTTTTVIVVPRRAFASDQEFVHFVETAQGYFEATNKELEPV